MSFISIDKDKFGVKIKFPGRKCTECRRYPCFKGIDKCHSNFAMYGCTYFAEPLSQEWL